MASPDAASWAADHGYTNVFCFRGGLPEWIQAGYETVSVEKLPKVEIPVITTAELEKLLSSGEVFVLLDIRPAIEVAKLWIESGNRFVLPFEDLETRVGEIPKGKKLVVVDVNGKRSALAGRYLSLKGYENISRLDGGMNAWVSAGKRYKKGK